MVRQRGAINKQFRDGRKWANSQSKRGSGGGGMFVDPNRTIEKHHDNGKSKSKIQYSNGIVIKRELFFDNGCLKKVVEYNHQSQQIKNASYSYNNVRTGFGYRFEKFLKTDDSFINGKIDLKTIYYEGGQKKIQHQFDQDGKKKYTRNYYMNGQVKSEYMYDLQGKKVCIRKAKPKRTKQATYSIEKNVEYQVQQADYYYNLDKQESFKEAIKWYRKAAKQGDAYAQFSIGCMYYESKGVTKNYKTAMKWYVLAAENGNSMAQYNLGVLYYYGKGVGQDFTEAVKWYKLAAENGHHAAQSNLGTMYNNGQGVTKNSKTAAKWYELAAEQNDHYAQYNLSNIYINGQGIKQDYILAYKWCSLALTYGDETVVNTIKDNNILEELENGMTSSELSEAKKLLDEYHIPLNHI